MDVVVGPRTRIASGAVLYADCEIGADCVIGPNAVIGWVGLAYHDRRSGERSFFPHLAGVRIGNGVDVGAQACVCRGMLSHTTIGDDAKIGSLVYVSHGVVVDARAWLSAGTAVAGHATIGAGTLLGIGSVVVDNVRLDAGAIVGGGSVVTRHAPTGS
jgi:UDP-3-O-[3-hydroxymyristoyl] glucosamine N-acyltransferase